MTPSSSSQNQTANMLPRQPLHHSLPEPPLACALPPMTTRPHNRSRPRNQSPSVPPPNSTSSFYSWNYEDRSRAATTHSHPSPASTSSTSTSSLRTPPDLLLNGNTIGHIYPGWKASPVVAVNSWNGTVVKRKLPTHTLTIDEINKRRKLLATLPNNDVFQLPSPPATPPSSPVKGKTPVRGTEREQPSLRSRQYHDQNASTSIKSLASVKTSTQSKRLPKRGSSTAPHDLNPPLDSLPVSGYIHQDPSSPLSHVAWTPELLSQAAAEYRLRARDLKHSADNRLQLASVDTPTFLADSSAAVSSLEQLDAVLLFCYAFYLDDQAAGASTLIANNWSSLFGLLRYVANAQAKLHNDGLLGLCRLAESTVVRLLHTHDQRLLRRLETTPDDPNFLRGIAQLSADLDRSDRLLAHSRRLLSIGLLQTEYPQTWTSISNHATIHADLSALVLNPASYPACSTFAYPIDPITPIPHLVCFGRTLLREHALRKNLDFQLIPVRHPTSAPAGSTLSSSPLPSAS